jgi:hypothetical protein
MSGPVTVTYAVGGFPPETYPHMHAAEDAARERLKSLHDVYFADIQTTGPARAARIRAPKSNQHGTVAAYLQREFVPAVRLARDVRDESWGGGYGF